MAANVLQQILESNKTSKAFVDIVPEAMRLIPNNAGFEGDIWNAADWSVRRANSRTCNLDFNGIKNEQLKTIAKLWILDGRLKNKIQKGAAQSRLSTVESLSQTIKAKPYTAIKTADFYDTQTLLSKRFSKGTAFRRSGFLQQFSTWFSRNFGVYIDYTSQLVNPTVHGRFGTEDGKEDKLIPDIVLKDLIETLKTEELSDKDEFYFGCFIIFIASGFRISELASLPVDCLLEENGSLHIRHFPAKGGKGVPRPVHPEFKQMVEESINNLSQLTNSAREVAARLRKENIKLDWTRIIQDKEAFRYFVMKWAHEWTKNPNHNMINPSGAWYTKRKCFVDAISALKSANNNKSQAAKDLNIDRNTFYNLLVNQQLAVDGKLPVIVKSGAKKGHAKTNWDNDERVISAEKLAAHTLNRHLTKKTAKEPIIDIIEDAQSAQLRGEVYPAPVPNPALEEAYKKEFLPLVEDKDGNPVIYPEEALLVTQKYQLSVQRKTIEDDFKSITVADITRWFGGHNRSKGTGNHEDSVFSRHKIIDPRTGDIMEMTSHDIRHWLNTIYQNGGLTEDQIALIFNRKHKQQNAVYDQTSNKVRSERMKNAIRDKIAIGRVAETYSKLADFSREEAEDYLRAVTRMVNPMPHGVCMLDWSTTPCPHHLSCFSCESDTPGPCEHLVVDTECETQILEIKRLSRESDLAIEALELQGLEDSPQIEHYQRVKNNIAVIMEDKALKSGGNNG